MRQVTRRGLWLTPPWHVNRYPPTPHPPRYIHHQAQLGPLVFFRDQVALDRAGEAALRADRQAVQIDEFAGLVDAAAQRVGIFKCAALGRHQAKDDAPIGRHMTQRLEVA